MTTNYNTVSNPKWFYRGLDGKPLVGGKLYSYKATNHATLKPIYTDALGTTVYPNPMTSNAIGGFPDVSEGGHELHFADDELYYLEVRDSHGNLIDSFDNFPNPTSEQKITETVFTNYIGNPEFLFTPFGKYFPAYALPAGSYGTSLAAENWRFRRSNAVADIEINFENFLPGQTGVPGNPKHYFHYVCSNIGTGGESYKDVYIEIKNADTFSGQAISFGVYGKSSTSSTVQLIIEQYFGTGGTPSASVVTLQNIVLTPSWAHHKVENIIMPSVSGKTFGTNLDDKLRVGIRLPLNVLAEVELTRFQLNMEAQLLEYDYRTFEEEKLPARFSTFYPDPPDCNTYDAAGTPYHEGYSTNGYNYAGDTLVWHGDGFRFDSPVPVGSWIGWFCEKDAPVGYVSCVARRWLAIGFYRRLYSVFGTQFGSNPGNNNGRVTTQVGNIITFAWDSNGAVTHFADVSSGIVFAIQQTGDATHNEITNFTCPAASTLSGGEYFTFQTPGGVDFYCVLVIDGKGIDPKLSGREDTIVFLSSADTAQDVATKIKNSFNPLIFSLPEPNGYFLRVWDHGVGIDPDRTTRTNRGDGTTGDHPGTFQSDEVKSHTHTIQSSVGTGGSRAGAFKDGTPDSTLTSSSYGANETRGKNIYTDILIKF